VAKSASRQGELAASAPAIDVRPRRDRDPECSWEGDVTWRETADLRQELFDSLEVPGASGLRLDVRGVSSIDRSGIALLIGANHRAAATGRQLILIDANGTVTNTLARMRLSRDFSITSVGNGRSQGGDRPLAATPGGGGGLRQGTLGQAGQRHWTGRLC
jgi:anti-anti-sigma factor